ncbi:MAG: AsmA-like C-terminal domain-containing protein [Ghiorsea sp.]
MLVVLSVLVLVAAFIVSPNIKPFTSILESQVKQSLHAEHFSISNLQMAWNSGPVVDMGQVKLVSPSLSIEGASATLSYSVFQVFRGSFSPQLKIRGGTITLDLDAETSQSSSESPPNLLLVLENNRVEWKFNQEVQSFYHVQASVFPDYSDILFKSDGVDFYLKLDEEKQPKQLRLQMDEFAGIPKSWLAYVTNLEQVNVKARLDGKRNWNWSMQALANAGALSIPQVHVNVPVSGFDAQGSLMLEKGTYFFLKQLDVNAFHWKNHAGFADFTAQWKNDTLNVQALDGSTTMPLLWSWLWMLGEDEWHTWLNSMQHGHIDTVQATLSLPWQDPLHQVPTSENLRQLKYHVQTHVSDADIALGLEGDFLYHIAADVEIDQDHLTAQIDSAVLNDDVGTVFGDYTIAWDSLIMDVDAKGLVDVGKLHNWLDPESAKELHWGKAPANANVIMKWDVNKNVPYVTKVNLMPTKQPWKLKPKGLELTVSEGVAVWDINKGLNLDKMHVQSPWFDGEMFMFLNKNANWDLERLNLSGIAPLADLTEQFSLPITKPEGEATFQVDFGKGKWLGHLDLTYTDWTSFAGFDKQGKEALDIKFEGQPTSSALLPIQIGNMHATKKDFRFESSILIDEANLDFQFKDIYTAAIQGDLRLLMPFDQTIPWGIETKTTYLNKKALTKYFEESSEKSQPSVRPWRITADTKSLVWDKFKAKDVHLQYSSDKQSVGNLTAGSFVAGDADLSNVSSSFTLLEKGTFDLHALEAEGSGQHVSISGSVKPSKSGVYKWQGIALMTGKFGTLMKQAELDQLFQEGKMTSLFLGKGEFKEGEPWWRGMQGSFRLRVDEGRIMEGGTLTRLLAAISLFDLPKYLIFQRGDLVGKGLFYDKLQIEAGFDNETLDIKQLAMTSSALDAGGTGKVNLSTGEIDILLIARPWQNIEAIIGNVPVLGYVLAGEDKSFLRKVYRIHGPASDAAVDEMDPEEAGLPRSGLLEHLFSLPGKWFGN